MAYLIVEFNTDTGRKVLGQCSSKEEGEECWPDFLTVADREEIDEYLNKQNKWFNISKFILSTTGCKKCANNVGKCACSQQVRDVNRYLTSNEPIKPMKELLLKTKFESQTFCMTVPRSSYGWKTWYYLKWTG